MNYRAAQYRSNEGRTRWAVYCRASRTWIFPERYGRAAAESLARSLNQI